MFKFLRQLLKEPEKADLQLQKKFGHFRQLLEANNQALATMADLEEKLTGEYLFDSSYLAAQVEILDREVGRMITELNHLTQDRYRELNLIHQRLLQEIRQELTQPPAIPETPLILPLQALDCTLTSAVGSKMANLGEIANRLHLPVPAGWAITAAAYKCFFEAGDLARQVAARLAAADIRDLDGLEELSRELQHLIREAPLPAPLAAALAQISAAFAGRRLAIRSSAVGEDTELSFAGQFATHLNIDPEELPEYYKAILASKFTARAIFYWKYQRFTLEELPMAVGVLEMIPARASGIMFTVDPQEPESGLILVSAVWGLGKYAVDGTISPDVYYLNREGSQVLHSQRIPEKPVALVCREPGGLQEIVLPPEQAHSPCLEEKALVELRDLALQLERHFGGPQDIEWAQTSTGEILLLQSRPLRLSPKPTAAPGPPKDLPQPLLTHGIRAVGGKAAGPVFILKQDQDIPAIPAGAVVVIRQPLARLVLVMDRLAAIITEVGSPTDHMTILAREFQVPTLVDVAGAMTTLTPGQLVTVDADRALIYPGLIPELVASRPRHQEVLAAPIFQTLRRILQKISPLHLLDPTSPEFRANNCRSLHDLTRFCHEKAMDAMFSLDVEEAVRSPQVCRLQTELPLNLFILDLGGGLRVQGQAVIREEDIISRPFLALLRGFHHPNLRWSGQVAVDLKGFISVFANTLYDLGKADTDLGGKSFAIISDSYLNFHSRLGYHFGMLDAYLSEERNDNYITFQFKGGAATLERRERRARLLQQILTDLGFKAQAIGDLVRGRLVKYPADASEQILEQVGRLLAFARQLDLALASDQIMARVYQAYTAGDYSLNFLE